VTIWAAEDDSRLQPRLGSGAAVLDSTSLEGSDRGLESQTAAGLESAERDITDGFSMATKAQETAARAPAKRARMLIRVALATGEDADVEAAHAAADAVTGLLEWPRKKQLMAWWVQAHGDWADDAMKRRFSSSIDRLCQYPMEALEVAIQSQWDIEAIREVARRYVDRSRGHG
jgi:hypothetical protein